MRTKIVIALLGRFTLVFAAVQEEEIILYVATAHRNLSTVIPGKKNRYEQKQLGCIYPSLSPPKVGT